MDLDDEELKYTRKANGADRDIEVGDYVRTKEGIIDKVIINYDGICNSPNCNCKHVSCKYDYYDEEDIINHSKNIIDLIEINDVVMLKDPITNESLIVGMLKEYFKDWIEDIRKGELELLQILTKEQYEYNTYKLNK